MAIRGKDHLTPKQRSWNMSRIRSKDTKPEIIVRKKLFSLGYRYRLHAKELPGKPDIVLPKYKTAIFVHGCFWHRHQNCKKSTTPIANKEFWREKFRRNVARDRRNKKNLELLGWKVLFVWECETRLFAKTCKKTVGELGSSCRNKSAADIIV